MHQIPNIFVISRKHSLSNLFFKVFLLILVIFCLLESSLSNFTESQDILGNLGGEHITDIYITETGTTELENLSHNIIDIFIIET